MQSLSIIIPLSIVSVLAIVIAAAVLVVSRLRSSQPIVLSFLTLITAYFYMVLIISAIVVAFGLSTLFKAGLSDVFGRDFSYGQPPSFKVSAPPVEGPNGAIKPGAPTPEEQQQRNLKARESQYRDNLIEGITISIVGALIWLVHFFGMRKVRQLGDPTQPFFHRAYIIILLVIFTVVGIVSLPQSVYESVKFYLVPADEFTYKQGPGGSIGMALVFVPLWIMSLTNILRQVGKENSI